MSKVELDRLGDLRRTLAALAQHQGVTVPETVQTVKAGILRDGADPKIVAGFFCGFGRCSGPSYQLKRETRQ